MSDLRWRILLGAAFSCLAMPALAQEHQHHDGMDMPDMQQGETATPDAEIGPICSHMVDKADWQGGSGTSRVPFLEGKEHGYCGASSRHGSMGAMVMAGDWMLMAHGSVALNYTRSTGPRGDEKAYVTSMAMLMGERATDWGRIELRAMTSLEPAMDASGYPNLFATGETAHGAPIVDRQHPHDLFMELTARIDVNAGPGSVFLYGGPVGEPALGPTAFVHRASARLNPEPPISHHWFDSTHITYGVVTTGYAARKWQIEASGFRGQEPDEHRWNIETPKLDSWSVRGTLNPTARWSLQASYGQIHQPEATHANEDEHRFTASAQFADGHGLSAMAAFSAKRRVPGETLTAWIGEANWDFSRHDTLFGRVENVANDELFPDHLAPLHDQPFRVTKLQAGYARRVPIDRFELALGGSLAGYLKPAALAAAYGDHPVQWTLFARVTLKN